MTHSADVAEFEGAILPHLNAAYNLARWLVRSDQDAQDIVHDSFLRARRYFGSFDGTDGRAWLLSIVRNSCMTFLKKRKIPEDITAIDQRRDCCKGADPEEALLTKESVLALRDCIEALPEEYREVIVMREIEELSYKEIAAAAGIAIGTVMSRLNRARKKLENCMRAASGQIE